MRLVHLCILGFMLAACDDEPKAVDTDKDGIADGVDNCPAVANPDQADLDDDGIGDACDADKDGDGFAAEVDCDDTDKDVHVPRPFYADTDGDGLGDPATWQLACTAPAGHVDNANDTQPTCATNDTDVCGVCGGPGTRTYYPDTDGDGLGDPSLPVTTCTRPEGFVDNGDDPDPECKASERDECGVCQGQNRNKDCAGVCFGASRFDDCGVCDGPGKHLFYADTDGDGLGDPATAVMDCRQPLGHVVNADDREPTCATNDSDDCGVCAGDNSAKDCAGTCFGEAFLDACQICVGGVTGRDPATRDLDQDGIPNTCDQCINPLPAYTIVQWTAVLPYRPPGGPYTFQVVLWENGDWAFIYDNIEPYEATATVGWQGPGGVPAVELGYNTDYLRDHKRLYFRLDDTGRPLLDYVVPIEFVDIQQTGTKLQMGDDTVVRVNLPFAFPFQGTTYSSVHVGANGFMTFSGADAGYSNQRLPSAQAGAMLAPFWDDLSPARGGQVEVRHFPAGCARDCVGDFGGAAVVDQCGQCVYGRSEATTEEFVDCNGDCFGEAFIDSCGMCAGGLTGVTPAPEDACDRLPDLTIDRTYVRNTIYISYLDVGQDACLLNERCITGFGLRKLIRFGTKIANIGTAPLYLGRPRDEPPWYYDSCHSHYHYTAYAEHELYDVMNDRLLPVGAKSGFCVMDTEVYDPRIAPTGCTGYNCMDQGISAGCADVYSASLSCQWIDVTGVPDGLYDLSVITNPHGEIDELNYDNNRATVRIQMSGDEITVVDP